MGRDDKPPAPAAGGGGAGSGGVGGASSCQYSPIAGARAISRVLTKLEEAGCRPVGKNGTWTAFCPGHHDGRRRGLSIREAPDGRVLLHCFHGRPTEEILTALGLSWGDLFPPEERRNGSDRQGRQERGAQGQEESGWASEDEAFAWLRRKTGCPRVLAGVLGVRYQDGGLCLTWPGIQANMVRRGPRDPWTWEAEEHEGRRPDLWPLPLFPARTVWLTEGPTDCLALRAAGLPAYASVKGAGRDLARVLRALREVGVEEVIVVYDLDSAGRAGAEKLTRAAQEAGLRVRVVELPHYLALVGGKDICDLLGTLGGDVRRLREVIEGLVAQTGAKGAEIVSADNKGGSSAETIFLPASQLLAQPQASTNWVLPGYLAKGGVTLLSARPKLGKTSLAGYIVRALLQGGEVIGRQATKVGRVAYLSEEPPPLFADRLRTLGLDSDRLLVAFRHQARQPLPELVREALNMGAEVLVIDTLAAWAGIEDENAATEVEKALRPVISLAQEKGATVLLLHHLNKSDGPEGTAHRGSSHLVAMADVAVELRQPEGNAPETRRVLRALSRYQETPRELVIDLQEGGYVALGTTKAVLRQEAAQAVLSVLPGPEEEGIPFEPAKGHPDAITERVETALGKSLPRTTLQEALALLLEEGLAQRLGEGKRGSPYLYRRSGQGEEMEISFPPNSQSYNGGNKTQAAPDPGPRCEEEEMEGVLYPQSYAGEDGWQNPEEEPPPQDPPPLPPNVRLLCPCCGGEAEILKDRARCLACLRIFTPPRIPGWVLGVLWEGSDDG